MAGSPKKRARKLAMANDQVFDDTDTVREALTDSTPDSPPQTSPYAPAHNAPARARAREENAPPSMQSRNLAPGPQTREVIDHSIADEIAKLSAELKPGLIARIWRTRPSWAAGWIEDTPLDTGKLADLLTYLSDEHGGQVYRITLLLPDGRPYQETSIPIAGPPRRRGRPVDRDTWEGQAAAAAAPQPAAGQQGQRSGENLDQLVKLFATLLDQLTHNSDKQFQNFKDSITESRRESQEMFKTISGLQGQREPDSLSQLVKMRDVNRALVDLARELNPPTDGKPAEPEKDMLEKLADKAGEHFLSTALGGLLGGNGQREKKIETSAIPEAQIDET